MENKKLTKKELEAIKNEKRNLRSEFANAINEYWENVAAAEKYLKLKGQKLEDAEREEIFYRNEILKDYKLKYEDKKEDDRMWTTIRILVNNYNNKYGRYSTRDAFDKYFTIKLDKDDLVTDEIIWNLSQLKTLIREAQKYGYERIFYMNNGSGAMEVIGEFLELGAVIEGNVYDVQYSKFGLIININNIILEEDFYIEDPAALADINDELTRLGEQVKYDFATRDIQAKLILKYAKIFGLVKTNNTINNYINMKRIAMEGVK